MHVAADLKDGDVPKLMYHKAYRARYTLKRDLDKLRKEVKESPESKHAKQSEAVSTSTSGVLQKIYIFCKKSNKCIEGVRENLSSCQTYIASKTVREFVILKDDQEILSIATNELVAKEAVFRATCYRRYTICIYNCKTETKQSKCML